MKRIALLFTLLIGITALGWGQIISQYVESNVGSFPKGIEVWNNTSSTLDFATNNLIVQQGTNGGSLTNAVTVSTGTLLPGAVMVIGTTDIGTYLTGQGLTVPFKVYAFVFNGDDALAIKYRGVVTDNFGNPGNDPGSNWSKDGVSTENQNIQLLNGITEGDLDGWTDPTIRFETVSTTPATLPEGLAGFGIAPISASNPSITTSLSSLTGFTYSISNGPSASQSFSLSGSNLDPAAGDITVTPPSNYEVSSNNTTFSTSAITFPYTDGTLSSTNVYVRLKEGLSVGNYSGSVNITGGGANQQSVSLSGSVSNAMAPALTADITNNNVDNDIEITFTDDATWRAAITAVKVGSSSLNSDDYEISAGVIKLKPSLGNALLTVSGTKAITVSATEYSDATVSQIINPGAPTSLIVTKQPGPPFMNGDILETAPEITIKDLYNNTVNTEVTVTATANESNWTLGGILSTTTSNGKAIFTNLTATSSDEVLQATINFTTGSLSVNSNTFYIPAPWHIALDGSLYLQDFNSLASTGTSAELPQGWMFMETGTNSDGEYDSDDGSATGGNTYSYGETGSTERAFGTLFSGSLESTIGAKFVNNTGIDINTLFISYVGEQWRLGTTGRQDKLDFQYSLDATSLSNGIWVDVNELDFVSPVTSGTGLLNGDLEENQVKVNSTFEVTIPAGASFFIRYTDYNASGADDGLAIDDFNIQPVRQFYSIEEGIWEDELIWNLGEIPSKNDNVIISEEFPVTLNISAECRNLTIESELIIEPNRYLIVNGEASGNASVKYYIENDDYNLVTLPTTNSISAAPVFNGYYVDEYDESTGAWSRLTDTDVMVHMKGYSVSRTPEAPTELSFSGPIKGGAATFNNLSYTEGASGYGFGWNLIGNPFTSYIDLTAEGVAYTGLNAYAYLWNGENYEYSSLEDGTGTSDGLIYPYIGFFVKTINETNSLTFANEAKTYYIKKNSKIERQELKFTVSGNNYSDIMMFVINPESTYGFDQKYDAYKLYGIVEAPQLYTMVEDEKTSISHIPGVDNNSELPILIEVGAETQYTISVGNLDDFLPGTGITLKDKISGNSVDLRQNPSYTFTAKPGDNADRFSLLFSPLGTPEAMSLQANVYAIDKEIRVQLNESAKGEVKITSLAGQVLAAKSFQSSTQVTLKAPAQSGVYMVTVVTEKGTMTRKVFIK